MKINKKKPGSC